MVLHYTVIEMQALLEEEEREGKKEEHSHIGAQ